MIMAGEEVLRCVYPGYEHEPQPGEVGVAKQGYCGLPDPVAGEPNLPPTGFQRR